MPKINLLTKHPDITSISVTILFLTVVGAFLRLYGLGSWDYYNDELWHVYIAAKPTLKNIFYTNLVYDGHPVLTYIIQHYFLQIADNPWMARMPSLLFGIATIPLGYFLGKEMFGNKQGGIYASFFIATSGLLIEQSDLMRGYAIAAFFCGVSLWSVLKFRTTNHPAYLLIYFIFIVLGFLNEWGILPVALFMSLHLLYSIYKQPRFAHLVIYGITHIAVLGYLVWFRHIVFEAGLSTWGQYDPRLPFPSLFLYVPTYFLKFFEESMFLHNITRAPYPRILMFASLAFAALIMVAGFLYALWKKHYNAVICMVLAAMTIIVFGVQGSIPLAGSRRNIGFVFAILWISYYGIAALVHYLPHLKKCNPVSTALGLSAILCALYMMQGASWRHANPFEFQQTVAQKKEIFDLVENELKPDDIMVMTWLTYLHFWNENKTCREKRVSVYYDRADCFKAPIYILNVGDMRADASSLGLFEIQQSLQEMKKRGTLTNVNRVWITAIEHVDYEANAISYRFVPQLRALAQTQTFKGDAEQLNRLADDTETFADFAFKHAKPRLVGMADNCVSTDDFKQDSVNCMTRVAILALARKDVEKWFLTDQRYVDYQGILKKNGY